MDNETVLNTLRAVRQSDDVVDRLKAESLEARRERIKEAMADPAWALGPAELVATYPKHAIANKNGTLVRFKVVESEEGSIAFEKPETLHIPMPTADIGREVMETALAAVDKIYLNETDEAAPMVAAIANAIYTSGDLRKRVMTEVAKRSVARVAWWHDVVAEHMADSVERIDIVKTDDQATLINAVEDLKTALTVEAQRAAAAIERLAETEDSNVLEAAARDIATDLKYAIQALDGANRESVEELTGVYEGIGTVATQLRTGARFLESLAGKDGSD